MRWLVPKKFDIFDSRGLFGTVRLLHTHTGGGWLPKCGFRSSETDTHALSKVVEIYSMTHIA